MSQPDKLLSPWTMKSIEDYIKDPDMLHSGEYATMKQLLDTMRRLEEVSALWFPICSYLQDNPEIIGAKVGDSLHKKLLEFLEWQRNMQSLPCNHAFYKGKDCWAECIHCGEKRPEINVIIPSKTSRASVGKDSGTDS